MDSENLGPEEHSDPKRRKTFHQGSLSTRQHDHYTIAWICALYIEMAAAKSMLDEVHEAPPRDANDTNSYVLGSIKKHNIVIACLPEGQYGTISAATIATNIKRTFPGIRMALMVGIGGGVPNKQDIRLGDVVVGTRIMQYDLLKIVADGKYERIAIPRTHPPLLGTALTSLRAKHEESPSRVPSILHQKLQSHIMYSRPSVPDRLFQATYEHKSQTSNCDFCDQSKLISRSRRPSGTIEIHYGGIASGNQVMKHGTTRDNLARELDIICFEMEAAGPMDIIPCLPIRGICDYSDSHKNKEWQRYAAATAAAYARELIEEIPVFKEQAIVACLPNPDQDTNQDAPGSRRQRLMKSLEFIRMESRKTDIKSNHAKTCQWLLDHPGYQDWLDPARLAQHYGFLWISGKPGAGKSTIMKFAYSSMKKARRADAKTASFFFNARGGYLEKSTSGLYRSLLLQLLEGYRDLQIVLDDPDILPQNQEGCPSLTILKDLFRNAISALGKRQFTCFVDALDECDEQQVMDMVEFFEDLGEQATDKGISFRVCFSSRHYPYIVPKRGIRLKLEDQPGHAADLATYITNRLRINDSFLIEELRPELLKKAAGVFMWVVLVVQILNEEDRQGGLALRKRIAEIPSDLSKLFKDILTRDNTKMNSLLLCIRWILFAERPLQPEEFRHALWSGLSLKNMADTQIPASIHSGNRDSLDKIVISSSKGLAEISRSKLPTVQFIHESVRDFLIKDNGLHELWPGLETDWKSSSHEELKKCCNFYLKQPSISSYIQDSTPSNPNMQEEILNKFPFSKYATQNILYHANAAAEMVSQSEFLSDFPISSWIKMNNSFEKHRIREYTSTASLIYILADRGYSYLVRTRLQEDSQVHILGERYRYPLFAAWANGNKDTIAALLNSTSTVENGAEIPEGLKYRNDLKDYKNRTPLTWAAQDGRLGILRLLLKAELTIDEADGKGRTGLSRASENGHETVAKLLIDHGADVNANDQSGWTPLIYASKNSHEAVVKLLIDSGANVNIEHPLMFASENGYEAVVKLLIDNGANVNTNDQSGCTPLMYALLNGHEAVARLLIDNGANVNANSQSGWTPLIFASKNGHKAMARLLINNGANVNANDQSRWTPFTHALLNGHEAVVKLLIDSGANVDIKYPIIHASKNGYEAVARLLIDNGADVNANDQNGCTPLIYASLNGHEVVARLLIDNGANVNANSQSGWTPLTRASLTGREAVARVLIDNGADVNANDQSGWTPLIYSSLKGHEAVARLLIENGANVNGIDQIRWTPLIHASLNGHEAMARLLIDNGADINASDQLGWTPLIHASFNGHEAMARLLIENGANVNANDQSRWTALIHASFFGHEAVVQLLIDNRADINASDQLGWTPLIHASFNGHEAVARLLIDNGASMNASD